MKINILEFYGKYRPFLLAVSLITLCFQVACSNQPLSVSLTETEEPISADVVIGITPEFDTSTIYIKTAPSINLTIKEPTPVPSQVQTLDEGVLGNESPIISIPATATMTPSLTPSPTNTPWTYWSYYMTFTPTPSTSFFRITNLAAYSYVTSPIQPEALVSAGEDGLVIVELIGEEGRSINKENINYSNYVGQRFGIAPEIDFKLETLSEYGRLIIYTRDKYSRLMNLTSVELILLEMGSNSINTPNDDTNPIIIHQPQEYAVVKGGVIPITGVARKLSDSPIIIECIDQDSNVVGDALIEIESSTDLVSHVPFEAFLTYTVSERTNVRFTFKQESASRLPGTIFLSSFEITLEP